MSKAIEKYEIRKAAVLPRYKRFEKMQDSFTELVSQFDNIAVLSINDMQPIDCHFIADKAGTIADCVVHYYDPIADRALIEVDGKRIGVRSYRIADKIDENGKLRGVSWQRKALKRLAGMHLLADYDDIVEL